MKKTKIIAILVATAMAMGIFAGCGPKQEQAPAAQPETVVSSEDETIPAEMQGEEEEAPLENVTATGGEIPESMSPTTGRTDTTTTYKPVIVQIDNSTDGRKWQTGLTYADVVYETANEIDDADTRLTAVFNDIIHTEGGLEKVVVGSLRSARYYHQWLASEWDAMFVHMGGPEQVRNEESEIWNGASSPYIKQRITGAGKASNANMIFANDAGDPISHYAMVDVVADAGIYNYEPKQRQPFKYYPLNSYEGEKEITDIKLTFSPLAKPGWVEYQYDAATDKLTRYMAKAGKVEDKATGEGIEVQNLIVQYVPYGDMPGDPPRAKTDLFGTGPAEFIIHGKHMQGTWERATPEDSTVYKLDSGEEVTLAPGNTWIAIHPNNMSVEVTYADGQTYASN